MQKTQLGHYRSCPSNSLYYLHIKGEAVRVLVGGAVRNQLLNIPITDKDWVVVGSTPDEFKKLGYKPVGKDFPVFLHQKHEEYALARTERKVAKATKVF